MKKIKEKLKKEQVCINYLESTNYLNIHNFNQYYFNQLFLKQFHFYFRVDEIEEQITNRLFLRNKHGYNKRVNNYIIGNCDIELADFVLWRSYYQHCTRITSNNDVYYIFKFPDLPKFKNKKWCLNEYTVKNHNGEIEYYRSVITKIKFHFKKSESLLFANFQIFSLSYIEELNRWIFVK